MPVLYEAERRQAGHRINKPYLPIAISVLIEKNQAKDVDSLCSIKRNSGIASFVLFIIPVSFYYQCNHQYCNHQKHSGL